MNNCQHAPLSGAALMEQCTTCGEFYDVAPPRWMAPRWMSAGKAPRKPRRQPGETIDTSKSVFERSSVMTPLATPRKPRAPRAPSLESECRAEYDRYILALFDKAMEETNGNFHAPDARGDACKYTGWQLFTHRKTVIARWASEELLTFFCFNRRMSYAQFRDQYRAAVTEPREVA